MRLLHPIFHLCCRYKAGLLRRVYRKRAYWRAALSGGYLEWPITACAAVPVRADGPGHVSIGERAMLGYLPAPMIGSGEILLQARDAAAIVSIGPRTATSNNVSIVAMKSVQIGEGCQIGDMVTIFDSDFHEINPSKRNRSAGEPVPVTIGDNVWLGSRVIVLKGVSIGNNSVIAAGAVVTKPLPANVIAAGVPARVVRNLTSDL